MANLISRLIMDATQYDGGLQKAQKSLDKFLDKTLSGSNGININTVSLWFYEVFTGFMYKLCLV